MNEWASKIMNISFPNNGSKADFERYMSEVRSQNIDYMSYQKDFDEEAETKPTFEQVPLDLIMEEANKNILVLKALENIMQDRMQGYNQFLSTLSKSKSSFDIFQYCSGSLRQSLDSFFLFIEQELQQARQQNALSDIRRTLSEVKVDAQKKLSDYQKEIMLADKEVANAEKKLAKTKEQLERHLNWKEHLENELGMPSSTSKIGSSYRPSQMRDSNLTRERPKDSEDLSMRYEREIKDDIRAISRAMSIRDEVLVACRKAFQNLDRDCKKAVGQSLKKLIVRERETNAARNAILDKLESTVDSFDVDSDIQEYIFSSRDPDRALVLQSQALNILSDLNPNVDKTSPGNSQENSQKPSPVYALTDPFNFVGAEIETPGALYRQSSMNRDSTVATNPNSQAFSQLIFSVHNMFGNASSLFAAQTSPGPPVNIKASRQSFTSPEKRISNTQDRLSPVLQTPTSTATPSSDPSSLSSSISSTTANNNSSAENLVEKYVNCIFYAKKGFEISAAAAVATAISTKYQNSLLPLSTGNSTPSLSAPEALKHCLNTSASKDLPNVSELDSNMKLEDAVAFLVRETEQLPMRSAFTTVLNKFRSKKVDVGTGFTALGAVLWAVLMQCQATNDVHSSKVIMMLIQTFYRKRTTPLKMDSKKLGIDSPLRSPSSSVSSKDITRNPSAEKGENDDNEDEDGNVDRGVAQREYLKEILVSHPIWQDGNFWEQVLWQCAIEQLQTVPYTMPWHDMDKEKRLEMVVRVHNIIFSQVVAIAHSMQELGCGKSMIREFVYRMCVIHQLSEAQRQQMLVHLLSR